MSRLDAKIQENAELIVADLMRTLNCNPTASQVKAALVLVTNGLGWIADEAMGKHSA